MNDLAPSDRDFLRALYFYCVRDAWAREKVLTMRPEKFERLLALIPPHHRYSAVVENGHNLRIWNGWVARPL
jgi:hypothetical protein